MYDEKYFLKPKYYAAHHLTKYRKYFAYKKRNEKYTNGTVNNHQQSQDIRFLYNNSRKY